MQVWILEHQILVKIIPEWCREKIFDRILPRNREGLREQRFKNVKDSVATYGTSEVWDSSVVFIRSWTLQLQRLVLKLWFSQGSNQLVSESSTMSLKSKPQTSGVGGNADIAVFSG